MKNAHKWGANPNLNPNWPAVDEEHECRIEKQYLDMWGGWFGFVLAIPTFGVFAFALYAIVLSYLNYYL